MNGEVFLHTRRLFFRRFTARDAPLLFELDSDPEVMRYISRGRPTPRERIETEVLPRWLGYYDAYDHFGVWAAHERSRGDFVGWFHLRPDRYVPQEMELGYRLRRAHWGHGYATEGGRALVERAFTAWDVGRVVARTLVGNAASRRVMEKCGLRFEDAFTYEEDLLPGWSEAERRAVKYALDRHHFLQEYARR